MKLKFESDLDYQLDAVNAVVGLFEGQELCKSSFTVATIEGAQHTYHTNLGIGNRRTLVDDEILENVKKIQLKNGIRQSQSLGSMDFTVEMETGTGKTYVYLRSIFELNRKYGFTKFIVVVPSIAIKEGVYKSLEITREHFKTLYDNVNYDFFVYDSSRLEQVRSFATNDSIQIMVINIDAFRKSFSDPEKESSANLIHRVNDKLSGNKPIEFIADTNPIVIIDEPQSVDNTPKAKSAIASLNPLCTLRYSATHREKYNLLYKLDSIDAYEKKLVKQIEVASVAVENDNNQAYVRLVSVDNKKSPITARVEIGVQEKNGIKNKTITVKHGDDLQEKSKGRDVYAGYLVSDIYCGEGREYIEFDNKDIVLYKGQETGSSSADEIKRLQIGKTIEEHLTKELKLKSQGVKVLSLFFLDKVANYRYYDDEGNPQKGKYAMMFEEEYKKIVKKPKFRTLFEDVDVEALAEEVHNGYFAIDGKKKDKSGQDVFKESKGEGTASADDSAYHLIMQDKERLLSFDCKLRFIFSHSALREGWDNPNVFQICTLNESGSERRKRQEIGRGLRIAVDQNGMRKYGFDINTLTVMANESYEKFVSELQKQMEEEEGIRFGVVEDHTFANVVVLDEQNSEQYFGHDNSVKVYNVLRQVGYIDEKGYVQDSLRKALKENDVRLPLEFAPARTGILAVLHKVAGKLNIKNADDKRKISLNKKVYLDPEFKQLWDRIKYKTTYKVCFNTDELIELCADALREAVVPRAKLTYSVAGVDITKGGVKTGMVRETAAAYGRQEMDGLPDIVTYLQNETGLTRKTVAQILVKSGRLSAFKDNPQGFIDAAVDVINRTKRQLIVDGIKYEKIGDDSFYAQELFENNELYGYLSKNMIEAKKSVYDHVVYDSDVEAGFAEAFERNELIKYYAKLPSWFKIDTPLGGYNPDWAVLVEKDKQQKLYFVVETKGSLFVEEGLRGVEKAKIECGKAHFTALGKNVQYEISNSFDHFEDLILREEQK